MRVAVLGTGGVGRAIAGKLLELGHEVTMGSRSAGGEALAEWLAQAGAEARGGAFADAAAGAELVFNCTAGTASLAALGAAGAENLAGKTAGRRRQPARLLAGDAADPHGLQRRQPRRADPGAPSPRPAW